MFMAVGIVQPKATSYHQPVKFLTYMSDREAQERILLTPMPGYYLAKTLARAARPANNTHKKQAESAVERSRR